MAQYYRSPVIPANCQRTRKRQMASIWVIWLSVFDLSTQARAVYKPELGDMVDVIVCPISGYRRFAELLAGGMYVNSQRAVNI
jgi:hypothetical protein